MVSTTLALNREDDGKTIRLAVGDTVQVTLPELDPLAAWKVDVDSTVITYAEQSDQESYWLLGDDLSTFVRIFQARGEGVTELVLTCQKIGDNRVQVLDTWRVTTIVGNPRRQQAAAPTAAPTPQQAATPAKHEGSGESIVLLFELLLMSMAAFLLSSRLATLAINISDVDTIFGLLGALGTGIVTIYVAVKLVSVLLSKTK